MTGRRATRIRRALLALAFLAVLWAGVVALTGGFAGQVAGVRVSSRNVWNPILLAIVSACAALVLSLPTRGAALNADVRWWWSTVQRARHAMAGLWWVQWADLATMIAIGGAALQVYDWAGGRPLWLDEEMLALNVRDRSLAELTGSLWLDQTAPFGWLATQRGAMLLLGRSEIAVRFVPVLFGIAMLAAARWVGRRWMTAAGGSALVALCALGQWVFHYSLELKHYSADIFFALLLPAMVVWAMEAEGRYRRLRRATIWWVVSAAGLWWANGALFVTPVCAVALWSSLWRVDGRRSAVTFAVFGFGWLLSLALHYIVALRFALGSGYLREYWSFGMPPASAGAIGTVGWLIDQAAPFAVTPGGTQLPVLFWVIVFSGALFARPRILGYLVAAIPLSACVLAAIRFVPLYERLSLWVVPALYVAIALCIDAGIRWARDAFARGRTARAVVAGLVSVAGLWLCIDISARGWRDIMRNRPLTENHSLDDRAGVTWLMAQRRPGDAVLTTLFGLPAVWWYGGVSVAPPISGGSLPDGSQVLQVAYHPPGPRCDEDAVRRALVPYRRALVFLGFRFDDVPDEFDDLLLRELEEIGGIAAFQRFAGVTRAAILQLAPGPRSSRTANPARAPRLRGCLSVEPARRW